MAITDRMNRTGTIKRKGNTKTTDGAGGYTWNITTVGSITYHRWLPKAFALQTIRTEHGLQADAEVYKAAAQYNSAVIPAEKDWIVEASTSRVFRILSVEMREGGGGVVHHVSLLLTRLTAEPVTA